MPFYTFHCEECETTFDVRATIQEREAGFSRPAQSVRAGKCSK